jgi:hypothetical protein
VGQVYRIKGNAIKGNTIKGNAGTGKRFTRSTALVALSLTVISTGYFVAGQFNYMASVDKYGRNNSATIDYKPSPVIPCFMYFDAESLMLQKQGDQAVIDLAEDELNDNPRCVAANIIKAQQAINSGDLTALRTYAYHLHEIAPARGKSIEIGMYYATKAGDAALAQSIQRIMRELNLIYVPGPAS